MDIMQEHTMQVQKGVFFMAESCPISYSTLNAKTARVNALLTSMLLLIALVTPYAAITYFLAIDFFVRGFTKKPYSLLAFISNTILKLFKQSPKMTNAGPKIFAAKIGFVFSLAVSVCSLLGAALIMDLLLIMFLACAALEGFFGFCVACKLYPLMKKK